MMPQIDKRIALGGGIAAVVFLCGSCALLTLVGAVLRNEPARQPVRSAVTPVQFSTAEPTEAPPTASPIPPTDIPTDTPVPPTEEPTATPIPPTEEPTATPIPPTEEPTATPILQPTPLPVLPTETPQPPVEKKLPESSCDCSGNIYNCGDFNTSADAQACYLRCLDAGAGDVHDLDRDSDGNACEWSWED